MKARAFVAGVRTMVLWSLFHSLLGSPLLKQTVMAPKRGPRPGFIPVNLDVLLSVEERRERIRLRRAAEGGPYPAVSSSTLPSASCSTGTAVASNSATGRVAESRSDLPDVRNIVRGGRNQAFASSADGFHGSCGRYVALCLTVLCSSKQ